MTLRFGTTMKNVLEIQENTDLLLKGYQVQDIKKMESPGQFTPIDLFSWIFSNF